MTGSGIWQFTRSTAKLFMRVDHIVDERMDPWRATDGAARLLASHLSRQAVQVSPGSCGLERWEPLCQ